MKKIITEILVATSILLSVGNANAAINRRGRNAGTVVVSSVYELMKAIKGAPNCDVIVVSTNGSPYYLDELPCMGALGHLVVTNGITIRGQSGRPEDVVLVGTTNRILYVKTIGCKVDGLTFSSGNCTTQMLGMASGISSNNWGGAIYFGLATNECAVSNCIFTNNAATRGGAIASMRAKDPYLPISGCRFYGNRAEENGGGVYNGGLVTNSFFCQNQAEKVGGAVCYGMLNSCLSISNSAAKGRELSDCSAELYRYVGEDSSSIPRFHNIFMDRCRFTATNGVLFSGNVNVRSSLISDGCNIIIAKGWIEEYYSEDRDEVERSGIYSCSIISNRYYQIIVGGSIYNVFKCENCLFYGNSIAQTRIKWDYINNGCIKSIYMTKGERWIALGWDGELNGQWIFHYPDEIEVNTNRLGSKEDFYSNSEVKERNTVNAYHYFTNTWAQYYYALGWDGRATSFISKDVSIRTYDSPSEKRWADLEATTYHAGQSDEKKYPPATSNLTWEAYYYSLGWNGESDYVGEQVHDSLGHSEKLDETSLIMNRIGSSGPINYGYYYTYPFSLDFIGARLPENPYAITMQSPACHENFADYDITPWMADWMYTAKDLLGNPRLSPDGKLDIGAYQAIRVSP